MSVSIGRGGGSGNQVLEGLVEGLYISVTDVPTIISKETHPSMPWVKISGTIDGPDPVYASVNKEDPSEVPLNAGDSLAFDLKSALIERIVLVCDQGKSSKVRMYGLK